MTSKTTNPLDGNGLVLITPDSSIFESEVTTILSSEALAKAKPLLPGSVVVLNRTGRYIWSFTVIFTYPDQISPSGKPWTRIVSPTAGTQDHGRMLAPNAAYFITPIGSFYASRDADGRQLLQPVLDEGLDRVISLYKEELKDKPVIIDIDSVIFDDGVLLGPDKAHRLEKVNDEARADTDLAKTLGPLSTEELRHTLQQYSDMGSDDAYTFQRLRRARLMLKVLEANGEADVRWMIQQLSQVRFAGASQVVRRVEE